MAIAKLHPLPKFDLTRKPISWEERRAEGKKLRSAVPRESHAEVVSAQETP